MSDTTDPRPSPAYPGSDYLPELSKEILREVTDWIAGTVDILLRDEEDCPSVSFLVDTDKGQVVLQVHLDDSTGVRGRIIGKAGATVINIGKIATQMLPGSWWALVRVVDQLHR